jgi:hypothetical protein
MWLLTKIGFYSITKKPSHLNPDGPAVFNIRGRDKADLKRVAELVSPDLAKRPVVHEYDYSDYPYRIYLNSQQEMDDLMAKLAGLVDYNNFKDTIDAIPHQKLKSEAYHKFWGLLENSLRSLRPHHR